jgi:pimeloyl-ACP methyl ester carboxylesterase
MSSTASDPASAQTIVLIHGMWMTPLSWEHWSSRYSDRGHRVLAPAWPGLEAEPEELRRDPSPLRNLSIRDVVDHYDKLIRGLDRPPIIIGHSFGGLFTQLLLDRGLGAAGVTLGTGAPKGVLRLPLSTLRAAWPALRNPANFEKGNSSDAQAIPLVLHERAQPGRVGCRLSAVLHSGVGAPLLPSRFRQLQPEGSDEGRLPEPVAAAAPARHRY